MRSCADFAHAARIVLQLGNISIACIGQCIRIQLDLGQIDRSKPLADGMTFVVLWRWIAWHKEQVSIVLHTLPVHTSSVLFFLLTPLNQIRPIHENRKLLSNENVNEMHAAHRWNIILQKSWRLDFKANHVNCQSFWMSTYIAISFSQSHTNIHFDEIHLGYCKTLTFNISDINEQKRVDRLKLTFDLKLIRNTKKEQKQKANWKFVP